MEGVALATLRFATGRTARKLATELGFANEKQLLRYENGLRSLSREYLGKLVSPLDLPPEAPDVLLWALGLIFPDGNAEAGDDPLALTRGELERINRTALAASWSLAASLRRRLERESRAQKVEALRQRAKTLAARLMAASAQERQDLIRVFPEFRSWAVAEELSHASERAASHKVDEALKLAEMALDVAHRVHGRANRERSEGYATAFLSSAQRVATEFTVADRTLARAWALWRAGAASTLPLAEWRLFDLEASLRREQHRFDEALARLDEAYSACDGGNLAIGRLLTKKAHILRPMGRHEEALEALAEATPAVVACGDRQLRLRLRFNLATNLCDLERYTEAEASLPEVRELAIELAEDLGLIRVVWLQSKLSAGQGRTAEAIAGLQQVIRDFAARKLPYEAALSSLDLAVLWLHDARTAEVKQLALAMTWIFDAKGIAREALAALSLFCEAARQELATVQLARQVIASVEKANSSAPSGETEKGQARALQLPQSRLRTAE